MAGDPHGRESPTAIVTGQNKNQPLAAKADEALFYLRQLWHQLEVTPKQSPKHHLLVSELHAEAQVYLKILDALNGFDL